jgi:restriction system protein
MGKLRPSGGYRRLATFQMATIIYDATVWFCERFIDSRSRTADQMVQAARSGRQNIAEGSRASATSSQTELRLVNVARSSLEELLLDYEDYLRHRHFSQWGVNSREVAEVRQVARSLRPGHKNRTDSTDRTDNEEGTAPEHRSYRSNPSNMIDLTDQQRWALYSPWLDHDDPAIRANALICLIHQANYLLDQQIAALEAQFIGEGGYSELLAKARLEERSRQNARSHDPTKDSGDTKPSYPSNPSYSTTAIPDCPQCGKPMALRTAKQGKNAGQSFWGCTAYPDCKGVTRL